MIYKWPLTFAHPPNFGPFSFWIPLQNYEEYMHYVLDLKFWLECVLLSIIGAFGFLGNIITFIVLKGQVCKNRNKCLCNDLGMCVIT